MTFNEGWKLFHGNCKGSFTKVDGSRVIYHCPVHDITTSEKVPYQFCRTPLECAGNGYCKKEFACND